MAKRRKKGTNPLILLAVIVVAVIFLTQTGNFGREGTHTSCDLSMIRGVCESGQKIYDKPDSLCGGTKYLSTSSTPSTSWTYLEDCEDGGGTCTPSCSGKECGSDGCGGSCGSCSGGEVCSGGDCISSGGGTLSGTAYINSIRNNVDGSIKASLSLSNTGTATLSGMVTMEVCTGAESCEWITSRTGFGSVQHCGHSEDIQKTFTIAPGTQSSTTLESSGLPAGSYPVAVGFIEGCYPNNDPLPITVTSYGINTWNNWAFKEVTVTQGVEEKCTYVSRPTGMAVGSGICEANIMVYCDSSLNIIKYDCSNYDKVCKTNGDTASCEYASERTCWACNYDSGGVVSKTISGSSCPGSDPANSLYHYTTKSAAETGCEGKLPNGASCSGEGDNSYCASGWCEDGKCANKPTPAQWDISFGTGIKSSFSAGTNQATTNFIKLKNTGGTSGKPNLELGLVPKWYLVSQGITLGRSFPLFGGFDVIESCGRISCQPNAPDCETFMSAIEFTSDINAGESITVPKTYIKVPTGVERFATSSSNLGNAYFPDPDGEYYFIAGVYSECGQGYHDYITKKVTISGMTDTVAKCYGCTADGTVTLDCTKYRMTQAGAQASCEPEVLCWGCGTNKNTKKDCDGDDYKWSVEDYPTAGPTSCGEDPSECYACVNNVPAGPHVCDETYAMSEMPSAEQCSSGGGGGGTCDLTTHYLDGTTCELKKANGQPCDIIGGTSGPDDSQASNQCISGWCKDGTFSDVCANPGGGGTAVCGNGVEETGEDCDDGNTESGDGCSSTCKTEGDTGDKQISLTADEYSKATHLEVLRSMCDYDYQCGSKKDKDGEDYSIDCLYSEEIENRNKDAWQKEGGTAWAQLVMPVICLINPWNICAAPGAGTCRATMPFDACEYLTPMNIFGMDDECVGGGLVLAGGIILVMFLFSYMQNQPRRRRR